MKLVKETISQINRPEVREDITGVRKLINRKWDEKYKNRNDLFWGHHRDKKLEQLYNSELFLKKTCIPRKLLPNCNGKETPEEQKYNGKRDKRKGTCRIKITKDQI